VRRCAPLIVLVILAGEASAPATAADNDQHRAAITLKRMDAIANAIEAYIAKAHRAPDATSIEGLRSLLSPAYIAELPTRDEWNTPFRYAKTGDQSFRIISAGSDAKFDEKSWSAEAHTNDFTADAVYVKSAATVSGKFSRVWVDSLGAPLATSSEELKTDMESLAREELAKTRGMSQEEARSYLAASGTKRTMEGLRILLEIYKGKHGAYPQAKSITDLAEILLPDSAANVQKTDWWDTEFRYSSDGKSYRLVSAGKDRTFNPASWDERGTLATTDDDAVIRDGQFIRIWDEHTRPGLSDDARRRAKLQPAARALLERADGLAGSR
jgi:hypothetical protein